jgi:hypothetical protein
MFEQLKVIQHGIDTLKEITSSRAALASDAAARVVSLCELYDSGDCLSKMRGPWHKASLNKYLASIFLNVYDDLHHTSSSICSSAS